MTQNTPNPPPHIFRRLPKTKAPPMALATTTALSGASMVMLGFAVPELIGYGFTDLIKAAVIAAAGGLVAYGVNRLAVERGAPLAAIGNPWAGIVSSVSIMIVGGGLATATYAGFVIGDVHELRLQAHGEELAVIVDERSRMATQAGRSAPVVDTIHDDLLQKQDCEIQTSCLSGRGRGGYGPVARVLAEKLQRAETIATQVKDGEDTRAKSIDELNRLLSRYQDALVDPDAKKADRRKFLQATHAEIGQTLSALDEAVPTALLTAYASELQQPIEIAGRREASRKVSDVLAGHGAALDAVLASVAQDDGSRPAFPARTGVSDTFAYIGHFLPVAAIVVVVELIFPTTLWLYTFFALVARVARDDPPTDEAAPGLDSFAGLVTMAPVETSPPPVRTRRNSRKALNGGE